MDRYASNRWTKKQHHIPSLIVTSPISALFFHALFNKVVRQHIGKYSAAFPESDKVIVFLLILKCVVCRDSVGDILVQLSAREDIPQGYHGR